ncbi:MAG: hypothetical protein N2439_14470 [Anaerolineae bacterium]|nr:hypothetical protein [Anaerolineae bacterium]
MACFVGQEQHQGYPGRMHGGIIAALLDEVAARAMAAGATTRGGYAGRELRVRYRQPVPLGVELVATGRVTAGDDDSCTAVAGLRLPDGAIAVEAHVRAWARRADPMECSAPDPSPPIRPVTRKQPNSRMCFVCGTSNGAGLKVRFYEHEDGGVSAHFTADARHTDHAGQLSLAAIAAALDEAMGRAIMIPYGEAIWGVTGELHFRILRPAPIGVELIGIGRIISEKSRIFEGSGALLLPDGTVAVEGYGRYVKLDMVTLGGFDPVREEWGVRPD